MTILNGSYREFELDNGLRVILQKTPTQTIAGRLRVNFGALNENPGEEGLAHLLEHTLMSGGSDKYSPEIIDDIRGTFGFYGASTSPTETIFPVDMLSDDLPLYLDFVADTVFNPRMDSARFEEERQRVLREISDFKGNPGYKDLANFLEALYGKDSPSCYQTIGKEEVIKSVTPEELKEFHKRGYGASNMDLILAGNIPEDIEDLINNSFKDKPKGIETRFHFPETTKVHKKSVFHTPAPELYNHDNPEESNAHLSFEIGAPTRTSDDFYAADVLTKILGEGGSSRLFRQISQRRGLAYSIGSRYSAKNNSGWINISGNIQSTRTNEAIDAIFEEIKNMQEIPVSETELVRVKRNSKYEMAKTFESNYGHVQAIARRDETGITPEEYISRMDTVTPDDIQRVAKAYLPSNMEHDNYVMTLKDPLKK